MKHREHEMNLYRQQPARRLYAAPELSLTADKR